MTQNIRVIFDPALTGPENMGRDEALLECISQGESPPTLRFYQWDPPTISLGYFQKYREYEKLPPPAGELAVVRRTTGGGAILHDQELTYSMTLPLEHPVIARGPNTLYEIVHDALIDALHGDNLYSSRCGTTDDSGPARGPFFCFARRHCLDVLLGPDKLAGSAQRRSKTAVLQHGSIIIERRYEQQPAAAIDSSVKITADELGQKLIDSLIKITKLDFTNGSWRDEELNLADQMIDKYTSIEWTKRR